MAEMRNCTRVAAVLAVSLSGLALGPAYAAGDAGRGEGVFKEQCAECHSVEAGRNRKGPTLFGLLGRGAGAVPEFAYSDAMKSTAETWSEARLDDYIAHPRRVVPGGKMKYDGLGEAAARADLIAYLATVR